MLEERDTNKDGKLSKEEVGERMKENFDKIDANSDGFLDEAEITKMLNQFGSNRPGAGNPEGRKRPDGENKPKE
jgi:Ca2+-binding EF-hand superfamily protein